MMIADELTFTYQPFGKTAHQVFAYDDDFAVGFVEWKDDGNVTLVYVSPPWRRQGIGTRLLDSAIRTAREKAIPAPSWSDSYTPAGTKLMLAYTGEYHEPTLDPDQKLKVPA